MSKLEELLFVLLLEAPYLCVYVGGSKGPHGGGGRAVRVTGACKGAVAIAIERLVAEGGVREGERLRTLGVALHTARHRQTGSQPSCLIHQIKSFSVSHNEVIS